MMKALVQTVSNVKKSKINDGQFVTVNFRMLDGEFENKTIRFHCDLSHTKSEKFFPYLKPQAIFDNLNVIKKDGKLFIDGTSNFTYIGMKGQIK